MMKLRINPIVAEDLKNIKGYIAKDNEEMAVKTIQEIYARIENIQQFLYMGADLAKRGGFRTDYKYVICGNLEKSMWRFTGNIPRTECRSAYPKALPVEVARSV